MIRLMAIYLKIFGLFSQSEILYYIYISMKRDEATPEFQLNKKFTFQPCFQLNSSILERIFFIWSHELIRRGNQKMLDMNDLSDLRPNEEAINDYPAFSKIFYSFSSDTPKKLFKAFIKYIGQTFVIAGILATISNLLQFSGPLMINKILVFLNSQTHDIADGVTYVSILIGCYLLRTVIYQHSMHFVNLSCTRVLNSANSLIYHKILNLSSASRKYLQTGSIMNHINVDIMSFYYFNMMGTFVFSAPLMIIAAIVMLILEVGWIGLFAPVIFGIGMFFQNKIMQKGFQMRKDQLFWTDKRSKCVNEYFSGIRIIKYYGWEKLVSDKIDDIRKEQIKLLFKNLMYRTYVDIIMNMLPIFASILIFGVYSAMNGEDSITPAKVYTVLSVFNLIATPMRLLVMTLTTYMNAKASLERVDHFFGYEEKSSEGFQDNDPQLLRGDIIIDNAEFNWENDKVKAHAEAGKKLGMHFKKEKEAQDAKSAKIKKDQVAKTSIKKKKKKKAVEGDPNIRKKKKKTKKKSLIQSSTQSLNEPLLSSDASSSTSSKKIPINVLDVPSLKIPAGQFISVIGRVGAGKSTLLYAILGQIDRVKGTISRRGSVAYIPQVSWLRSATIRENILFQSRYDEVKYKNILKICELQPDLQILNGGDLTEIGQKGVNLSGGQKQRISIARALYADADIYLIDDCLSALDPYVGKNIFSNVLKDYLHEKGKTIVFVTNAIHFVEYTDRVIVIDQGKIIQDGPPDVIKKSEFYEKMVLQSKKSLEQQELERQQKQRAKQEQLKKKEEELEIKIDEEEQKTEDSKKGKEKELAGLVQVEERLKGSVPWSFYIRFFTGPGISSAVLMFLFISLAQLARVFSDWWLGEWGSWNTNSLHLRSNTYIIFYAGISVVVGVLIVLKGVFFAKFIIKSSRVIQRRLIQTLLKTPLSWFDVTPTGRIIARTTKDQDDLDSSLAFNMQFATQNILVMLSSIIIVSVATPAYIIVAIISAVVYYKLIGMYMNCSRQIKRLQANTRAPLITHISQTINGTYVIRAFNKTDKFIDKFFMLQKYMITTIVNQNITNRWINIVTDLFSILTIAAAGYFGVLIVVFNIGNTTTNLIGLSLVWALQINGVMSFTLRVLADTQSNMNSVVRIYDYVDNNPSQKPFAAPVPKEEVWPNQGVYSIQRISYRYRPQLPRVINQISFDIASKEKIGIVGRTGSGKSTMTLGLLRILELATNPDSTIGKIILDDENTSDLGLHCLRHKITIIPQDPTLFTGTIKSNVDPFNTYSDDEIADSLKKVSLWDDIRPQQSQSGQIRKKIYSKVDDSGSNFSLGQKQLICMARALIRKPKVLLMDQATASIDQKTDELIQKMIRTEFKDTTVITIAHRLNTIIYYDKILVLEKGEVKEYDRPKKLVQDENSFLGKLIRKTGDNYLKKILALAEKADHENSKYD